MLFRSLIYAQIRSDLQALSLICTDPTKMKLMNEETGKCNQHAFDLQSDLTKHNFIE